MLVALVRARGIPSDEAPVRVRVILVLDAPRRPERGNRKARDVARGEHVTLHAAVLVDDDAVVDREACSFGELGARHDPETGDDGVESLRRLEHALRPDLDAALAV